MSRRSGGRSSAVATTYGSPPTSRRSVSSPESTRRPSTAAAAPLAAMMRPLAGPNSMIATPSAPSAQAPIETKRRSPSRPGSPRVSWLMRSVASSRKRPVSNASAMPRVCLLTGGSSPQRPMRSSTMRGRSVMIASTPSSIMRSTSRGSLTVQTKTRWPRRCHARDQTRIGLDHADTRSGDVHPDRQPPLAPVRPYEFGQQHRVEIRRERTDAPHGELGEGHQGHPDGRVVARLVEPVPPEHGDEPVLDLGAVTRRVFGFDQKL